jgi:hypothetical protein
LAARTATSKSATSVTKNDTRRIGSLLKVPGLDSKLRDPYGTVADQPAVSPASTTSVKIDPHSRSTSMPAPPADESACPQPGNPVPR